MKLAFAFLLSMPGAPFIYYGDEIGMRYIQSLKSKEGGFLRTGSRTPMQWNDQTNAGFSSAPEEALYLPIDPDPDRPTVAKSLQNDTGLYQEIKKLAAIRKNHEALQNLAAIEFLYAEENAYPFVYIRKGETEDVLVALNPSDSPVSCKIMVQQAGKVIYSNHGEAEFTDSILSMPAASATFFQL